MRTDVRMRIETCGARATVKSWDCDEGSSWQSENQCMVQLKYSMHISARIVLGVSPIVRVGASSAQVMYLFSFA